MKRFALAALALSLVTGAALAGPAAGSATLGDLAISGAYARAMLPNQPVGGGYFTIHNAGKTADRLVGIATPAAKTGELHEMKMDGAVMSMRALPDGIAIPAGGMVALKPGGMHLMFTGVTQPFKAGGTVPVTLTFETAGKVELDLPVLAVGEAPQDDGMGGMDAMPGMQP